MRHIQTKPTFFIMAANGRENELISTLTNSKIAYMELEGMYKGVKERSFLVLDDRLGMEPTIRVLAREYNQESYLKVEGETRNAFLVYPLSTQVEAIGVWQETSRAEALTQSAYSHDPLTGLYYIVK